MIKRSFLLMQDIEQSSLSVSLFCNLRIIMLIIVFVTLVCIGKVKVANSFYLLLSTLSLCLSN